MPYAGRPFYFMIGMPFYFISFIMPNCLLDNLCAMHPVISFDRQAHERQYRHAVHKSQVVRTYRMDPSMSFCVCPNPSVSSQSLLPNKYSHSFTSLPLSDSWARLPLTEACTEPLSDWL